MAESVSGGWQGVVLPSTMPTYGETLQQGIRNTQQQASGLLQMAEQKKREDEQRRMQNLRLIGQDTDFDQYKTGEQHIDDYAIGELKKISDKALTDYINLPPEELQYRLQNDLTPLFKWHTAAQGEYAKLNNTLADLNKTYSNTDLGKARELGNQAFVNSFMQPDQNGVMMRKNPQDIQSFDYNGLFQKPEVLGQIVNDTSPFEQAIFGIPKESVGGKDYRDNKGNVISHKWSGLKPTGDMGEYVYASDGKPIGIKLAGTDIPAVKDANGNPMRILSDDMYKMLQAKPAVFASMEKMWQDAKGGIEANYQQKTGQPLDPNTDNLLKRAFLYQKANALIGHDLKIEEEQKVPRPQVSIYNNVDASQINDVYKGVDDKVNENLDKGFDATRINSLNTDAQNIVMEFARKTTGNQNINYSNVFLHKNEDGEIGVYKVTSDDKGRQLIPSTEKLIGFLPKVGTNLKAQAGVGEKRAVIQGGNSTTPPPKSQKYSANGKSYTHGDLLKLGYTEEQIQQAIKLGNIKPE